MTGNYLFHGTGGKPVSGHIDDVIGSGHDKDIAVFVDNPASAVS
jgi:hypothetical protein